MAPSDLNRSAPRPTVLHPDDAARQGAQIDEMLRQVQGLLGTVSAVTERIRYLASQLRGLREIGGETDPVVQYREQSERDHVQPASPAAGTAVLAKAQARGRSHLEEMVSNGELVPGSALAQAWKCRPQSLVAAEARHELFSLRVKGKRFYLAELVHLERQAVSAICVSLYPLNAMEKYFFWKRKHGSLHGQTVMERLGQGSWKDDLAAVLNLAIGVSDQDRLGVAMQTGDNPVGDATHGTSPLLVFGPG